MNFKSWILKFKDVNLPIGDLAREIYPDSNFPTTSDKQEIYNYLKNTNACDEILEIFDHAFDYYFKTL